MKRTRLLFAFLAAVACGDPVTDGAINALGGELPNVPVGEYHRAGQPCVDCHSPSGPASGSPFSVAGTIFAQPSNPTGVDQATIAMTDTTGSKFTVTTNCVGNFFVKRADWDPSFPIFVRVYKNGLARTMQGQIGRERSCANCHKDPQTAYEALSAVGHIYMYLDGDTPPPASSNCPVSPVVKSQ
ncbi:MAG TPA: hypothetical protein VLM85_30755 [Polyangiaceae bacterium]|nr:hypothetical protein [Polyangiaceae bacterium]